MERAKRQIEIWLVYSVVLPVVLIRSESLARV